MSNLRMFSWFYIAISASIFSVVLGHNGRRDLPSVDLGYEIRQGSVNVRYPSLGT